MAGGKLTKVGILFLFGILAFCGQPTQGKYWFRCYRLFLDLMQFCTLKTKTCCVCLLNKKQKLKRGPCFLFVTCAIKLCFISGSQIQCKLSAFDNGIYYLHRCKTFVPSLILLFQFDDGQINRNFSREFLSKQNGSSHKFHKPRVGIRI